MAALGRMLRGFMYSEHKEHNLLPGSEIIWCV
jgi:hypothetical protein